MVIKDRIMVKYYFLSKTGLITEKRIEHFLKNIY